MKKTISSWGNLFIKEVNIIGRNSFKKNQTPRGAGLSYNNIAMSENVNERIFRQKPITKIGDKEVLVAADVTIEELIEFSMPLGLFPVVVPGTKKVTIGGCIASNVHGKNHHTEGSFCDHVSEITVVLRSGKKKVISREDDDFYDFCGAFGTTGLITEAKLQLMDIGKAKSFLSKKEKTISLRKSMELLSNSDSNYTVVWVDTSAPYSEIGRGLFISGDWDRTGGEAKSSKLNISIPKLPSFILSTKLTFNTMNLLYYKINRTSDVPANESIDSFLFPLDKLSNWDNAYGKTGMFQFQAVTNSNEDRSFKMIYALLDELKQSGGSSFITVLKKFGDKNSSSFFGKAMNFQVENGYTLAIDLPATDENLELAKKLESITMSYDGKVYLAKVPQIFNKEMVMKSSGWGAWLDNMEKKYNFKNEDLSDFFQNKDILKKKTIVFGANSDVVKEILLSKYSNKYSELLLLTKTGTIDESIKLELGKKCASVMIDKLDLSLKTEVSKYIKQVNISDFDEVIYAAGLMDSQVDAKDIDKVIQVNQLSPISIFEEFKETKRYKGRKKSIVYLSSVTTMRGKGSTLFYSLSKKATEMYLEGIETKYDFLNIFVGRTGFVKSKMTEGMDLPDALTITSKEAGDYIAKQIKNKKTGLIQPQKIWLVVEFILKRLPLFVWRKIDQQPHSKG